MFRVLISDAIRREMRSKTDAVLKSVKGLQGEFRKNTRILERLLAAPGAEVVRTELKDSMAKIADSERKLDQTLHEHIQFLDKLSRSL